MENLKELVALVNAIKNGDVSISRYALEKLVLEIVAVEVYYDLIDKIGQISDAELLEILVNKNYLVYPNSK